MKPSETDNASMTEERWEQFAQKDAEFYIYSVDVDYSTEAGKRYFFESGRKDASKILDEVGDHLSSKDVALEIGCGTGRLALPMAGVFQHVVGIDIAPTMISKLSANAETLGIKNIAGRLADEPWENEIQADLIYSYLVFQHIEDLGVIQNYFRRMRSGLSPKGVIYAQFDSRPADITYRLRNAMPDAFLPKAQRRGIRRTRRNRSTLLEVFASNSLAVIEELRPRTEDNAFILQSR